MGTRVRLLAAFIDETFRVVGLTRCVRGRAVKWRGSEEIWWGVGWWHGAKCYTSCALGVKHSETDGVLAPPAVDAGYRNHFDSYDSR